MSRARRARPAGIDDDPLDRRIRPHADDQPARRPRPLPRRLDLRLWRRRHQRRPGLRQDERRRRRSRRRQSRCSRHPRHALCRRRRRSRREEHLRARPPHQNRRRHADSGYFELTLVADVAYVGPQIGRVSFSPVAAGTFCGLPRPVAVSIAAARLEWGPPLHPGVMHARRVGVRAERIHDRLFGRRGNRRAAPRKTERRATSRGGGSLVVVRLVAPRGCGGSVNRLLAGKRTGANAGGSDIGAGIRRRVE